VSVVFVDFVRMEIIIMIITLICEMFVVATWPFSLFSASSISWLYKGILRMAM